LSELTLEKMQALQLRDACADNLKMRLNPGIPTIFPTIADQDGTKDPPLARVLGDSD
jgi:hypothetical protein